MLTKEDLKQEIDLLDDHYLDLIFRLLQQFPHKQTKPNPLDFSRPINYPENEISEGTAFADIENAAEYGKQLRQNAWQRHHG